MRTAKRTFILFDKIDKRNDENFFFAVFFIKIIKFDIVSKFSVLYRTFKNIR